MRAGDSFMCAQRVLCALYFVALCFFFLFINEYAFTDKKKRYMKVEGTNCGWISKPLVETHQKIK